jgi:hypothetical protein
MLETNGLDPSRVARVVGYADTDLFIKENPKDPQNRRISIIILQPREGPPVASSLRKEAQASTPQAQQAQPSTSEPAVESAASKENAAKQSFQQKKAEMKKKKRDVMGLWD